MICIDSTIIDWCIIAMMSLKIAAFQLVLCVLFGVIGTNAKPPSAIVGGNVAGPNEFPYQASLRINNKHMCGGSIISPSHILTAAHCVEEGNELLYSMTVVTSANSLKTGGRLYRIKRITKHPQYAPKKNDIAIITLRTPIYFDANTKIISLPTTNAIDGVAVASGWGRSIRLLHAASDDLRRLEMNIVAPGQCKMPEHAVLYESHLCAVAKKGSGLCHGDSGGPLVANREIVGIAAFVVPCGMGWPDVFTRVYSFVDWIKQVIKYL